MKIRLPFFVLALFLSMGMNAQTTILDFETEATSTTFQYFGSTLDGTINNIVANPDASGINTSATVGEFIKAADSEVWAGAFSNPNPSMDVNVVAGNSVCMKVLFSEPGSMTLKLENGSTPNWVTTQDVTVGGAWSEVCFDTNDPSFEDPFGPAAGGIYSTITIFFNFGSNATEDVTYYFDDVIVGEGTADPADITFAVDMNNYTAPYINVFLSGTFNDWSGNGNPLTDEDGDGVFTTTISGLQPGNYEYKFQLDEWAAQEEFGGKNYACTVTDGQFTNRLLAVSTTKTLNTVCWNSCYGCGDAVNITVNLGGAGIEVSDEGLFIAGGENFGSPGDNQLLDEDGDDVYSAVFEKQVGFESFYTFTNGACGDYSCKENIEGQSCANPDNFNDRKMGPAMEDLTISTCFGVCTTDTDCEGGGASTVTFSVDMNSYTESFTTVFVAGTFNEWSGGGNPMSDADGDGIYTTSVDILPGTIEYKFELDEWAVSEEFNDGDPCTITDPSGTFVNRVLEVGTDDIDVCFLWSTCDACEIAANPTVTFSVDMSEYVGGYTTVFVSGDFNDWNGNAQPMTDEGDGIWTTSTEIAPGPHEYKFQLDEWAVSEQFVDGDPCTITDPSGQFVNRAIEVGSDDMEVCFFWETCTTCLLDGVSSIEAADNLFVVAPSLVQTYTTILLNETYTGEKELILFNTLGEIVKIETIGLGTQEYLLSAEDLQNGLYYLNIQTDGVQQTQKFIVNR